MTRTSPLIVAVSIGAATLPAPCIGQEEQKSISVDLPVNKDEAFAQTMAAFIDEGLVVTDASDGGVITVGPFVPNKYAMIEAEVVYRANVLPLGEKSRVMLSGTLKVAGNDDSQAQPITSKWGGEGKKAWQQLERIAQTIESSTQTE